MQSNGVNPDGNGCESATADCGSCSKSDCADRKDNPQQKLQRRMQDIRNKIVVLSGKGGVGKSTVSVNLAVTLARMGMQVGLLDVDIHGPSVPTMLGLTSEVVGPSPEGGIEPITRGNLKIMSIGFLLNDRDDAVIWRGPMKANVIRQFLSDVEWGPLDYLIIDSPPGTGDEPLSVCQYIGNPEGAVIVTTPQEVAAADVRKSVKFCQQLDIPVLGILENMSGFACPDCGKLTPIFREGGGARIAEQFDIPFLGSIPIDPAIAQACDEGESFAAAFEGSASARAFAGAVEIIAGKYWRENSETNDNDQKGSSMKIAVPLADGRLSMHFGHCEQFAIIEVDTDSGEIRDRQDLTPPPHEPGVLPRWLAEQGANMIIAGGMGQRAQGLFQQQGIEVLVGAPAENPEVLVKAYLDGSLEAGENVCDH
ncbi:MAG: iron-sulfur cluster carrier protein MrpORP [bacterium]